MTDEQFNKLESELASMRPRSVPAELVRNIDAGLASSSTSMSPWPDRFLLSAIGSGLAAACVIVAVLVGDLSQFKSSSGSTTVINSQTGSSGARAVPIAFAGANPVWADILK